MMNSEAPLTEDAALTAEQDMWRLLAGWTVEEMRTVLNVRKRLGIYRVGVDWEPWQVQS